MPVFQIIINFAINGHHGLTRMHCIGIHGVHFLAFRYPSIPLIKIYGQSGRASPSPRPTPKRSARTSATVTSSRAADARTGHETRGAEAATATKAAVVAAEVEDRANAVGEVAVEVAEVAAVAEAAVRARAT